MTESNESGAVTNWRDHVNLVSAKEFMAQESKDRSWWKHYPQNKGINLYRSPRTGEEHNNEDYYFIELERLDSHAKLNSWIEHLLNKNWERKADIIRDLIQQVYRLTDLERFDA